MADTRTLKLSILADVDNLTRNLNKADNEVKGFGDKLGKWSKMAAGAFAVAGAAAAAYAGKLLVDGVKSAIADSAAQEKLAQSLKNVTGATDKQIAATEDYITKTTLATGVADDELRPSLDRLIKSTKDITAAQKLQALALDISAGSGKSLDTVTQALAKAYEGNTTSLGRLGVGLDKAQLKSMTFDQITGKLSDTFKNQASTQAETFAGKMNRLQVAFDEGKETVGGFILDAITPLVSSFVNKIIPAISDVAGDLGNRLGPAFRGIGDFLRNTFGPVIDGIRSAFSKVAKAIKDNEDNLAPLWTLFKAVGTFAKDTLAPIIGTTLGTAFKTFGSILEKTIGFLGTVVKLLTDAFNWAKKVIDKIKSIDFNPFNNASFTNAGFVNAAGGTQGGFTGGGSAGGYTGGLMLPGIPTAGGVDRVLSLTEALASESLAETLAANAAAQGMSIADYYASRGGVMAGTGYYGDAPVILSQKDYFGALAQGGVDQLNAVRDAAEAAIAAGGTQPNVTNNYNITIPGTVVDPEGTARAISNVITDSASRTGDYASFGTGRIGLTAVFA